MTEMDGDADQFTREAVEFEQRYQRSYDPVDLERAIILFEESFERTAPGFPPQPAISIDLAKCLHRRYQHPPHNHKDLDRAIDLLEKALERTDHSSPDREKALANMAACLRDRHQRPPYCVTDLDRAIGFLEMALECNVSSPLERENTFANMSACTHARFQCSPDNAAYLERAIHFGEKALALADQDSPLRPATLTNLASCFHSRYQRPPHNLNDLNSAIELGETALSLVSGSNPRRVGILGNLVAFLQSRYQCPPHDPTILDRAILLGKELIGLADPNFPRFPAILANLAGCLHDRGRRAPHEPADLESAIDLMDKALARTDQNDPHRLSLVNNLAAYLLDRCKRPPYDFGDLNRAILLGEEAIKLTPPDSLNWLGLASNLAGSLYRRYMLPPHDPTDLDSAIDFSKEVLERTGCNSPYKPIFLSDLATYLHARYERTLGDAADIEDAILLGREALTLTDSNCPDRASRLDNLGCYLHSRYQHSSSSLTDLNEAICLANEVLTLTDNNNPFRAGSASNLAAYLLDRYHRPPYDRTDLERAILLGKEAVELTSPDNPHRSGTLVNLASFLQERYKCSPHNPNDLDQALGLILEALALIHPSSPHYPKVIMLLRQILRQRDDLAVTSLDVARRYLPVARQLLKNHPALAMGGGLNILDVALAEGDTALAADALTLACDARDIRLQMFPGTAEQEELLAEFMSTRELPGIGTQVAEAYLAHNNPLVAALALERCQASLLGRMARAHASIERLMSEPATMCAAQRYANAANRLKSLLAQIDDPKRPPSEKDIKNARDEFEAAIDGVRRADPSFLPDPIKTAEELLPLAPALYLAAGQDTGVAVLIGTNGSDMIALPGFTHAKVRQAVETVRAAHKACFDEKPTHPPRHFHATIDTTGNWLWQVVIQPLLPSLTDIRELVVVACGSVALLPPLQAAWTDTPSGGRCWLVDQLTLRYTPSLHTLRLAAKTASSNQKALAVTDPAFKGLAAATQAIAVSLFPKLLTHETKAKAVLSALSGSQAGLFFCHGLVKTNPRDTGILLPHDSGILSTWDLLTKLEGELPRTILVAACSLLTVIDDGQPEEVLSLGAALNGIGIQSSLAAGWDIDPTATFLLVAQLMTAWKQSNCHPAQALAEAQNWMRTTSSAEKKGVYDQLVHRKGLRDLFPWAKKAPQRDEAYFEDFHQPYYWAGFAAYG